MTRPLRYIARYASTGRSLLPASLASHSEYMIPVEAAYRIEQFSTQLTEQPCLGELPVSHDRVWRDFQYAGRFLDTQSAKETQLDDATLALVDFRERFERVVEGDEIVRPLVRSAQLFDERHLHPAAALLILPRPRVIDEQATHQPSRHREEVRAVLPVDALHVHEPDIRLVHQRSGLKRVTGALAPHAPSGDAMKLVLDVRNEPLERRPVAFPPGNEQRGDVHPPSSRYTASVSFQGATPQSVVVTTGSARPGVFYAGSSRQVAARL